MKWFSRESKTIHRKMSDLQTRPTILLLLEMGVGDRP